MNLTLVFTQIFGILFVVLGLSMVFNKKGVSGAMTEMVQNQGLLWTVGFLALSMGVVMVVLHNVWTGGILEVVITVIGWAALIKGVFILWFPNAAASFYRKFATGTLLFWWGIIAFIIGLVLMYKGWW
jgi:hypothetical protein